MPDRPLNSALRVLVVDDEPAIRNMIVMLLEGPDYAVQSFASPIEAARHLESHPVDLAFLDMMMPGMSGLELAAKVKASNPKARVVICTGYLAENVAEMQHAQHVDQVLLKPFQIDDVLKVAAASRTA